MLQNLKGMPDILPADTAQWQAMEETIRCIFSSYGFDEIRTPFLESTDLFSRSVGETTDIVEKEMYTFIDKNGESITLRPEGTASVVRAYNQHHLEHAYPLAKLYYMGPMFRHERPQKGRLRQFHQLGAEMLGSQHPLVDVEAIKLLFDIGQEFRVETPVLEINTVGDATCRPPYRETLQAFLRAQQSSLCETCQKRIDTNPMRVLDCKNPTCQGLLTAAPMMMDHVCEPCRVHFMEVQEGLTQIDVPFIINKKIVRGLDYYTKTAFEMKAGNLGSQNTVGGGGRYDDLVSAMGGAPRPAVGFAMGLERLLLSTKHLIATAPIRIDVIPLGKAAEFLSMKLSTELRASLRQKVGVSVNTLLGHSSPKSALKQSNKTESSYAILIGDQELAKQMASLKNLKTHLQKEVSFAEISATLLGELHGTSN